jgi:hypothetical protein
MHFEGRVGEEGRLWGRGWVIGGGLIQEWRFFSCIPSKHDPRNNEQPEEVREWMPSCAQGGCSPLAGVTDLRRLGQAVCATQVRNTATSALSILSQSDYHLFNQHLSNSKNVQLLYELYHDVGVSMVVAKFSLGSIISEMISLIASTIHIKAGLRYFLFNEIDRTSKH